MEISYRMNASTFAYLIIVRIVVRVVGINFAVIWTNFSLQSAPKL